MKSFEEELLNKISTLAKKNKRRNRRQELAHVGKHIRTHDSVQVDASEPGLWMEGASLSSYGSRIVLNEDFLRVESRNTSYGSLNTTPISLSIEAENNTLTINPSSQVGIGRNAASTNFKLDVTDSLEGFVQRIINEFGNNASHGLAIIAGSNNNPSNIFINFYDGDGTDIGGIDGDGAGGVVLTSKSDERLKTDIEPLESVLDRVNQIKAISYRGLGHPDSKKIIGLSAQNVREHFPSMVSESKSSGYLSVAYGRLVPVLFKAIQELSQKIEGLEDDIRGTRK